MMNTLFFSIRKHYTTSTINKKEPICGELVTTARKEGESPASTAPRTGPVSTKSRASMIMKTLRTGVTWKRKNIPSFEAVQGNCPLSSDSSGTTAGAEDNQLSVTLVVQQEVTLPADSQTKARMLEDGTLLLMSSPDGSVWQEEATLAHSSPISDSKIGVTLVVDSPLIQEAEWTEEEDITIWVDAHLPVVKAMSSALLGTESESALSPLSELAAYYELASNSKIGVAASITSVSSSAFLKVMSPSDFDLAHEEIFGLSPPTP